MDTQLLNNDEQIDNEVPFQEKLSLMTHEMNTISHTLRELHDHMNSRMEKFENGMYNLQSNLSEIRHPDSEVTFTSNSRDNVHNDQGRYCSHVNQRTQSSTFHNIPNTNNIQNLTDTFPVYTLKMKPQSFDGTSDLREYLTQFNIVAEINNWPYQAKALYLASCLTGNARSLLGELSETQKRDYDSLIEMRYGTKNKAEIYQSQLKSIKRQKGQSLPELAQSIRKLTRQAYPEAQTNLIEILPLDYFIDSLDDSEIRLRLRECCPKTMSEAETVAIRLETHKIVDQGRVAPANAVSDQNKQKSIMETVIEKLNSLTERMDRLDKKTNNNNGFQNKNSHPNNNNRFQQNRNYNRNNNNYRKQNQSSNRNNRNYRNDFGNNYQGNENRSSWGTTTRPSQN